TRLRKVYWAIVDGAPKRDEGRIDLPLKKLGRGPGWKMKGDRGGQPAVTDYKVSGTFKGPQGRQTWLELRPHTGRTHQLRVHCAALGCPVHGDAVYGTGSAPASVPLMLHARSISLPLYPNRKPIEVVAPPPPHMLETLLACDFESGAIGADLD
ncbi:MAG: RNA pseudouridine synthase, partial [Rhodospirillaceae bacterium]